VSYLLDTNVLSELRKGPRCNTHVATWFAPVPNDEIYLSVLVIGEIRRDIERLRNRNPQAIAALERGLTQVITGHHGRILAVDHVVAEEWGRITAVRPLSTVTVC